ncbi:PAS and ANTAR domain-containing protein [Nocardia sp. NPDC051030]|uniref:PAS and ANTAR domain-containing protein n=1 Tax=Nocardia sp. NPDC051030 TaxID=3155162 RepID=UPI00341837E1
MPDPTDAIELVIGSGRPLVTGSFRFWFADQRWEWSDEVAAIHGYEPGEAHPTTDLLLSHKHPEDRDEVADSIAEAIAHAQPFSSRHRILDCEGNIHHVIVVADHMIDELGAVVGTTGYFVDVTIALDQQRREILDETIPGIYEARAMIEQAKGALMLAYRINADQAFGVLKWRSQESNVKVRELSRQLVSELPSLPKTMGRAQTQFDHLLLTVHERIVPC